MKDYKLNPQHTFDCFLMGKSNTAAHATALAAASNPSTTDTPLFIYGPTGTGKTHLIQAIGNAAKLSLARVCYQTSEEFTNSYIKVLRAGAVSEFREEITNLDFLLIDDIQFLLNKERTQQEFLQTFEILISDSKRVVVTADRAPKELIGMSRNLLRLFEGALVTGLNGPDQKLKISILQQSALGRGIEIPDDVVSCIASACATVRELEGALNKLVAECPLLKASLYIDTARRVLEILGHHPPISAELA